MRSVQQTGIGPGVFTHADFKLITEANPVLPGETIIIFLTGVGALNPPIADGSPGPVDRSPLDQLTTAAP